MRGGCTHWSRGVLRRLRGLVTQRDRIGAMTNQERFVHLQSAPVSKVREWAAALDGVTRHEGPACALSVMSIAQTRRATARFLWRHARLHLYHGLMDRALVATLPRHAPARARGPEDHVALRPGPDQRCGGHRSRLR